MQDLNGNKVTVLRQLSYTAYDGKLPATGYHSRLLIFVAYFWKRLQFIEIIRFNKIAFPLIIRSLISRHKDRYCCVPLPHYSTITVN
jgi:hypothetical protein